MNIDDLILVSVDDHVVEPPDMFDEPPARAVRGPRPAGRSATTTATTCGSTRARSCRTSASTRSPASRPRSTASSRRRSPRCAPAATTSTTASATWTPTACSARCASRASRSSAASCSAAPRTRTSPWRWCRPTTTGTSTSGAAPTRAASSRCRSRRSGIPQLMADEVHRVAAKGCRAVTFSENPEKLGWPSFHSDALGPVLAGGAATRARSSACTSGRRRS